MAHKRRRLDPSDRREQLLDAAARSFGRMGTERARIEDIAAEAGVATGLLYRHFRSKEALLDALMERQSARFTADLDDRFAALAVAHLTPAELVREGLRLWLEQVTAEVAESRWVFPGESAACAGFRDAVRRFVAERISEVAPAVDAQTAWLIASAVEGVAERTAEAWRNQGEGLDQAAVVSLATRFCIGGLELLAHDLGVDIELDDVVGSDSISGS